MRQHYASFFIMCVAVCFFTPPFTTVWQILALSFCDRCVNTLFLSKVFDQLIDVQEMTLQTMFPASSCGDRCTQTTGVCLMRSLGLNLPVDS